MRSSVPTGVCALLLKCSAVALSNSNSICVLFRIIYLVGFTFFYGIFAKCVSPFSFLGIFTSWALLTHCKSSKIKLHLLKLFVNFSLVRVFDSYFHAFLSILRLLLHFFLMVVFCELYHLFLVVESF